jgi:type I restriction enzyme M protein
VLELASRIKAGEPSNEGSDEEEGSDASEEMLPEDAINELKRELAIAKKMLKALRQEVSERLKNARAMLSAAQAQDLIVEILRNDLAERLVLYVVAQRQAVLAAMTHNWEKYIVNLHQIEDLRITFDSKVERFLVELGYAK